MSFEKLPPVEGSVACLTCGCGAHETMEMDRLLAVGFGDCTVTKDREHIWSEGTVGHDAPQESYWVGKNAEDAALKEPHREWRVHFFAPLYEAEYQRQGDGHWVLISKGIGFA